MEKIELLTQEEEINLANLIVLGQEASKKLNAGNYTKDEIDELQSAIMEGEKARNRLIVANIPLATYIAKDFIGRGVEYEDLCQDAKMGLMKAADKYRPGHNAKFSTYAANWIKESILSAITNTSRFIRLPKTVFQKVNKYKRVRYTLAQELNREPSVEEIAAKMEESVDEIMSYMDLSKNINSLDAFATSDKESTYADIVADNVSLNPFQKSMKHRLHTKLYEALHENLCDDEIFIIDEYIGITNNKRKSFEEIAPTMNLSRERVRQIYNKALEKLRNCPQSFDLRSLMSMYE